MKKFKLPIRVYYEDTDAGGVVYHTNYLKFMERTRTEWLRNMGIEQGKLRTQFQLVFVMRHLSIEYLKPAFFDDLLEVTANIVKLGKVTIIMEQQILRNTDILCTAVVKIGSIDIQTQRPQKLPPEIFQQLQIYKPE
ncbi:MAG: tol-pal system-associated acyl-CoA thioesterase [Thiomargarita sp.]|nr:tol-pal system-associated acyl-CoA thioesterase [Thiomargarita sp.]